MLKEFKKIAFAAVLALLIPVAAQAIKINGPLEGASLEKLSSAPSPAATGRIYWDTTSTTPQAYSGSTWGAFAYGPKIGNGLVRASTSSFAAGYVGPLDLYGGYYLPTTTDQTNWNNAVSGANPMTTLGDLVYGGALGVETRLAGDTSNTRKFLRQLSVAGVSAAPAWDTLAAGDIPNLPASQITSGQISTTRGGTGQDFSGTTGSLYDQAGTMKVGILPVAYGGTSLGAMTAHGALIGNGSSAPTFVTPGSSGHALASNGTDWVDTALACSNLSNGAASCSTDTTNASNISSGTLNASRLPNPTSSTLGGVQSYAAVSNQWINTISTSGVPSSTQPACGNLSNGAASCSTDTTNASNITSGTLPSAQLPNPSSSTNGGVKSYASVSNQWINSIGTNGTPTSSQPAFSNLSGTVTTTQGGTGQDFSSTTGALFDQAGTMKVGILPVAYGGTSLGAMTAHGALIGNGSSAPTFVTPGTSGHALASNGTDWVDTALACSNLSNAATSCSTDTTNASNISSGTLAAARLPNPTSSTLGGVQSYAAVSNQWINTISTSGVPSSTQPACGNLSNGAASCSTDTTNASNISSGTLAAARLPNPTSSALGGVQSYAAVSNQWINTISTSGVPSSAQPAFTNISGTATTTQGGTGQNFASTTGALFDQAGTMAVGILPVAYGGTSLGALTANAVLIGNGSSAPTFVAPSTSGNVLTSNGTTWTSAASASGGFTPWFIAAYITATDFSMPTGSQTDIDRAQSDGVVTNLQGTMQIACASGTASSGTTCGGGANEIMGVAFTPGDSSGVMEVCVAFAYKSAITADSATEFVRINQTSNTSSAVTTGGNDYGGVNDIGTGMVGHQKLCESYSYASNAQVTFRLQYSGNLTTGTINVYASGGRTIYWTARKVSN